MSWLLGCIVIFFKGCIGSLLVTVFIAVMCLFFAGIITFGSFIFKPSKPKPGKKPVEDWKDWADKQDGELKSLVTEIDKDLKDEKNI